MNKRNELMILLEDHPDLPILPLVDCDLADEVFVGSIEKVYVGEYAVYDDRAILDRLEFKKAYYENNEDWLCENFGYNPDIYATSVRAGRYTQDQLENNETARLRLQEQLDMAAEAYFKKAIIVKIGMQ